jgi:hypothetical protein
MGAQPGWLRWQPPGLRRFGYGGGVLVAGILRDIRGAGWQEDHGRCETAAPRAVDLVRQGRHGGRRESGGPAEVAANSVRPMESERGNKRTLRIMTDADAARFPDGKERKPMRRRSCTASARGIRIRQPASGKYF